MCFLLAPSNVIFNVSPLKWCTKLTRALSCNIFHQRLFCETHKFNSDHKNSCHIRNRNITKRRAKSSSSFLNSKMCKMSGMKLKQQYYAFSASRTKNHLNIKFFSCCPVNCLKRLMKKKHFRLSLSLSQIEIFGAHFSWQDIFTKSIARWRKKRWRRNE